MTDALTDDRARTEVDLGDVPDDPTAAEVPTGAGGSDSGDGGGFIRRRLRAAAERLANMPIEGYITLGIVVACVVFTFVQLGPGNILSNTTPAGGDMGAHVWAPAYLRDNLLPQGRLTGWTPDWYAGFPAYQFYMVVPSLLIALLSYVIPYGVAFKLDRHQRRASPCRSRRTRSVGSSRVALPVRTAAGRGRHRLSCSTGRSRSTAATSRRPWPGSSRSRSR